MKTRFSSQVRERIGLAVLIVFSLYAILNTLNYEGFADFFTLAINQGRWMSLSITRYEQKWDCLRAELDPGVEIGFITPVPDYLAIEYHQLTQYTLAPVLLGKTTHFAQVIGYAPRPGDVELLAQGHPELSIIKQCEGGILLMEEK